MPLPPFTEISISIDMIPLLVVHVDSLLSMHIICFLFSTIFCLFYCHESICKFGKTDVKLLIYVLILLGRSFNAAGADFQCY